MSVRDIRRKRSRFNATGKSALALTPKFKLYKAPLSRIKRFTTNTACYSALLPWFTAGTLDYYGFTNFPNQFPAYNNVPDPGTRGMLAFVEATAFRIPRYMTTQVIPGLSGGAGLPLMPYSTRFNDNVHVLSANVTRTVHNHTTVPFAIRTFIFHNTGRIAPIWGYSAPLNPGAQNLASIWVNSNGLEGATYDYTPRPATGENLSGLKGNPSNLVQRRFNMDLTSIPSNVEQLNDFMKLDPDVVDRRSDFYADNYTEVPCKLYCSMPLVADGSSALVHERATSDRWGLLHHTAQPLSKSHKIDHFPLRINKRLDFEDEGGIMTCKQGDLYIVHFLVPIHEPAPMYVGTWSSPSGSPPLPHGATNAGQLSDLFGQIQITTTVDVMFTDGT